MNNPTKVFALAALLATTAAFQLPLASATATTTSYGVVRVTSSTPAASPRTSRSDVRQTSSANLSSTTATKERGYAPEWDLPAIERKDMSNFRTDLKKGKQSERYAEMVRNLLLEGSWEVKQDARAAETGRICVEFAHKDGSPSGILTTKSAKWTHHVGAVFDADGNASGGFLVVFDTDKVRQYVIEQVEAHSDMIRSFPNYVLLIDFADFGKLC